MTQDAFWFRQKLACSPSPLSLHTRGRRALVKSRTRSGRMFEKAAIQRALEDALAKPGTPHRVDRHACPLALMLRPDGYRSKNLRHQLKGRRLLLTCSSFRGWQPPVPDKVQEEMLIIQVHDNKEELRYGLRRVAYKAGQHETWEEQDTDEEAAARPLYLAELLVKEYGCSPEISLIGNSAGVDIALSVCSSEVGRTEFRIRYLVLIAGAYHPTIYDKSCSRLLKDDAHVFVLNHRWDTLCEWIHVRDWWRNFEAKAVETGSAALYMKVLEVSNRELIGSSNHDISRLLLSQSSFWYMLTYDVKYPNDMFAKKV